MTAHIIIQGLVHGVGFRFFAVELARKYHIKGYVRNVPGGRVEVVAEGDQGLLHDFIEQLRIGPSSAHVTGIEVNWSEDEIGYKDFDVRF